MKEHQSKVETYRVGDILQRIHNAMSIIITWIYTPLVSSMWMRSKLKKSNSHHNYEKAISLRNQKDHLRSKLALIRYAIRSYMLKLSLCISCFILSVAFPSSIRPRLISSKSFSDSSIGLSLQGLFNFFSLYSFISSPV